MLLRKLGLSFWCVILESSFLMMCCLSLNMVMGNILIFVLIVMLICLGMFFIKCLN